MLSIGKKFLFFLTLAFSCFSEEINDSYCNKAEAYSKRGYEETYYLISRCLEEYFATDWPIEKIEKADLLDYGCGTGVSTRLLQTFGFRHILGLDPSQPMIEMAKKLDAQGDFVVLSPDFDWNLLKGRFDLISSSFVFPVIATQEEIASHLQNAYFALKDEGRLLIVTASLEAFDPKYTWLSWEQNFPENDSAVNGEMVTVRLKKENLVLHDTLWSSEFLQKMFEDQSFKIEYFFRPLGQAEEPFPWQSELTTSPFDIYILKK